MHRPHGPQPCTASPHSHISANRRCSRLPPLTALTSHFARLVRNTGPVPPSFLPPALNSSSSVPRSSPAQIYVTNLGVRPSAPPHSTATDKAGQRPLSFRPYQLHHTPFWAITDHSCPHPFPLQITDQPNNLAPLQNCPSALRSPCSAPSASIGHPSPTDLRCPSA